jgi:hypothetical protein
MMPNRASSQTRNKRIDDSKGCTRLKISPHAGCFGGVASLDVSRRHLVPIAAAIS